MENTKAINEILSDPTLVAQIKCVLDEQRIDDHYARQARLYQIKREEHQAVLEFGRRVQKLREAKGFSREELAALLDWDAEVVQRIENGEVVEEDFFGGEVWSLRDLFLLARALNVQFFGGR